MMQRFWLFIFFFAPFLAQGQLAQKPQGKIRGMVVDSANARGIEFATVALYATGNEKPIDGTVCDAGGKFSISQVAEGDYTLSISFLGYRTKALKIAHSGGKKELDLGIIPLSPDITLLNEITVVGQKALYEEKVDRLVYHAENDATASGGDATDVLRRVPMLSVDLEGNVSLRGSASIKVLINNKPSAIMASSIADALKQIPADQIKAVEVITSPSARYDAEGSTGIINIVLKKNTLQGATLIVDGNAGLRGSRLGFLGNLKKGKSGFTLGGFGSGSYRVKGETDNTQTTFAQDGTPLTMTAQSARTDNVNVSGRYSLGWDYDFNKNNYLTTSVNYGMRDQLIRQDNFLSQYEDLMTLAQVNSLYNIDQRDKSGNVDASMTFAHLYEKPQRELYLMALYTRSDRTNGVERLSLDPLDQALRDKFKNTNNSVNEEATVQADYQTPWGQTQLIETGIKQIIRKAVSNFTSYRADAQQSYGIIGGADLTNVLSYDQGVSSAYVSYLLNANKGTSFKGGLRYEYTTIHARFQEGQAVDIPGYGILVPSINLSQRIKGKTVKLAYTRRVQRPSIQYLNPNIQRPNPKAILYGDPTLSPEFANNVELSYSTNIKKAVFNITAFARSTQKAIQSVRDVLSPDTLRTTYQNIGGESTYGANVYGNGTIGRLSMNMGIDAYYMALDLPGPVSRAHNEGWVFNVQLYGMVNLGKGYQLQVFGYYRGRQVQLQGLQGGMGLYNMALRKDFNHKKASIGLGAMNFFTRSLSSTHRINTPWISQKNTNTLYNTNLNISFNFKLGKMKVDNAPPRRKKSIYNDDLKPSSEGQAQPAPGGNASPPPQATPAPVKKEKKKG